MKKICYLISAGEYTGINIIKKEEDYVIAVDGGYGYAMREGICPDMILGDFDSLGFVPEEENIIIHNREKDDTDTMLAIQEGIKLGYKEFVIYCGLGGRLDHSMANIQTLIYLSKRNMQGKIVGDDVVITAITNGSIELQKRKNGFFSVFTFDEKAKGVSIKNAKYELDNAELYNDVPLGISNEFIGKTVEISVKEGTLVIFENK